MRKQATNTSSEKVMFLKKDYGYRGHKGEPIVVHKVSYEYEIVYGTVRSRN